MYDFTNIKPGVVIDICVKDFECVYLYNYTSTKPGAVKYMFVKDIEYVYLHDFSQDWSCISLLRISDVPICMILSVLS